jgi:hypothetical protein
MKKISALAFLLLSACTVQHGDGASSSSSGAGQQSGSIDGSLVGKWYTGRGGTTTGYDQTTGSYMPAGEGLLFWFRADGTYTKAFQDTSPGACTMGYIAFEDGTASSNGNTIALHPTKGHTQYTSCSGAADADQPFDVSDSSMSFVLSGGVLTLRDAQTGAQSDFRKLQ